MSVWEQVQHILQDHWSLLAGPLLFCTLIIYVLTPPAGLRHLPKIPILPLLWSYARGEVEDVRIKKLIVPFANETGEGVVLVFALGRWIVHVLDYKVSGHELLAEISSNFIQIAKDMSADISLWRKEDPPDELLLWRFIGKNNTLFSNGSTWRCYSRVVKASLNRPVPVEEFARLTTMLFQVMGDGGRLKWDDLSKRLTLDIVGTTVIGHEFGLISDKHNPFVTEYNEVMEGIASIAYIVFPKFERWFPRHALKKKIDALVAKLIQILKEKEHAKGNDFMTYMLEDPDMTAIDFRDNMVTFFIAGHDTSAGALSSVVYYFAKYPDIQIRARNEVIGVLGGDEPNIRNLRNMPFTQACMREALRINTPITCVIPRASSEPTHLVSSNGKTYHLPANTSVNWNICAIHYLEAYWQNAYQFDPSRFMGAEETMDGVPWIPFGLGPRQCPARNLAMYELKTAIVMMLQIWEWTLPKNSPHEKAPQNVFSPFALSLPKDLDLIFHKRCRS